MDDREELLELYIKRYMHEEDMEFLKEFYYEEEYDKAFDSSWEDLDRSDKVELFFMMRDDDDIPFVEWNVFDKLRDKDLY